MANKAQWNKFMSARINETSQQYALDLLWQLSLKPSSYVQSHDSKVKGRMVGENDSRMVHLVME